MIASYIKGIMEFVFYGISIGLMRKISKIEIISAKAQDEIIIIFCVLIVIFFKIKIYAINMYT